MRLPEGIVCIISIDVPELARRSVLDLAGARRDIELVNERIESTIGLSTGVLIRKLDPESGAVISFSFPAEALELAALIQLASTKAGFPCRMGITTRAVRLEAGTFPTEIDDRVSSIRAAAQEGQVVFDAPTKELVELSDASECTMLPLGLRIVQDRQGRERLFQLNHPQLPRTFAEPPGADPAFRLPSALTAFIGRWGEIDRVLERFYFSRAVTISGPAGLGKTRTAVQVAHELVADQPDGVWFVDLSVTRRGDLVADTILRSLPGYKPGDRPAIETLKDFLSERTLLLLLDNVEHVLPDTARVVDALCRDCPNVQFLCTSREPLGIEGESVIRLGPLELPSSSDSPDDVVRTEAMALLLDRIRVQNPDFEPSLQEVEILAEACREVDGIPLALELVASRLLRMSPKSMLRSLRGARPLHAAFRNTPDRHASLQRAMEWGYEDLGVAAKTLFHRASVFAGGFTLEAAHQVCANSKAAVGVVQTTLGELVRRSLLIQESGRYRMLRPMRDFALQKLRQSGELATIRDRHLDWMISLASSAPAIEDMNAEWFGKIEPEIGNAREALEWARSQPLDDRAFHLAYGLFDYWYPKSMAAEGSSELGRVLRSSRRLDWRSRARLYNAKAVLDMERGDFEAANVSFQSAARLAVKGKDTIMAARVRANIAIVLRRMGQYQEAYSIGRELVQQMPANESMWAGQQLNVASAAMDVGDYEAARERIESVREFAVANESESFLAHVNLSLGELEIRLVNYDIAQEHVERGFLISHGLGDLRNAGNAVALLVLAVTGAGLYRQAAAYLGCLAEMRTKVAIHLTPQWEARLAGAERKLRDELGERAYGSEHDRGRSLSMDDLARHLRDRTGEWVP